ncbi:MAG: metallophosphoesterase [Candidatus Thorarchaeota archaeon]|nr:MAG: metallophosphoesterase [Candidatus Thorarchaeota archaeon]
MKHMRIAAVGDIHCPRFLHIFERSIRQIEKPDIFLLAGDIVNRGKIDEYPVVLDAIDSVHRQVPIVACFGNEDYNEINPCSQVPELVESRVTFLDESTQSFSLRGSTLGVVGVSIINEKAQDIPTIRGIFEERARRLSELLQELVVVSDYTIILSHFSPLEESQSEKPAFSWWFGKIVKDARPSLIIHGHIHNSTTNRVMVESTPVYNVALPAVGSITEIVL